MRMLRSIFAIVALLAAPAAAEDKAPGEQFQFQADVNKLMVRARRDPQQAGRLLAGLRWAGPPGRLAGSSGLARFGLAVRGGGGAGCCLLAGRCHRPIVADRRRPLLSLLPVLVLILRPAALADIFL